jgi:hypothetical protein
MKIGVYVYGIAAVAYGITDLVWGEFDPSDQPLQAWGDHIPGARIFACIAAIWLVVAGAALLWRRSRRSDSVSGADSIGAGGGTDPDSASFPHQATTVGL